MEQFASQVLPKARIQGMEKTVVALIVSALALAVTVLLLYTSYFGGLTALLLRSMFFSLMAAAGLLVLGTRSTNLVLRLACYALAIVALLPGPYLYENYTQIIRRGAIANDVDKALFVATMVIVLVMARAYIGRTMVAIAVAALAYAYFGYLIPGDYGNSGYSTGRLASNLFLRTEGVYRHPDGGRRAIHLPVLAARRSPDEVRPRPDLRRSRPRAHRPRAGRPGADRRGLLHDVLRHQRLGRGRRGDHRHLHHSADEAGRIPRQDRRCHRGREPLRPGRSCRR